MGLGGPGPVQCCRNCACNVIKRESIRYFADGEWRLKTWREEEEEAISTRYTLKRGFPNHPLMGSLMSENDAVFRGEFETVDPYPMVWHPLPHPRARVGSGSEGRPRRPHYPTLWAPSNSREAYFAHTAFGEALWKKKGEIGISEYCHQDSKDYVTLEHRAKNQSIVADIAEFVGLAPTKHGS